MKEATLKKHKLVIDEWFVNGFNGTKAWKKIYQGTDENAARRFLEIARNSKISEYKKEKMEKMSNEHDITLFKQITRLDYIIDTADKEADKINAIKEQNKLLALYEEHNNQKKPTIAEKVTIKFKNKK